MKRTTWLGGFFVALAAVVAVAWSVGLSADAPAPPPDAVEAAEKELVHAAEQAYETAIAVYKVRGVEHPGEVYVWSRRWMGALVTVGRTEVAKRRAAEQHVARMKRLHDIVDAQFQSGRVGGDARCATKYYLAEARLM